MLPISSLSSSSVHSLTPEFCFSTFSFCSLITSSILLSLSYPSFYHFQFLSNLPQYSWLYLLSDYSNSFLAINLPDNSSLSNIPSSYSCLITSSWSRQYSFLDSSIAFFAFFKFSLPSQVSDSTVNPFQHTKYLSLSLTHCLFNILSTFYSSFPLIITRAGYSFLCPSTCPIYLCTLLTLTTRYILTVLGSSNSTTFNNTIFFTL